MWLRIVFYNLVLVLAGLPLALPYFLWRRAVRKKAWPPWKDRLALRLPPAPPAGVETCWIHAVSVGEVLAVAPLIAALRQERPGVRVYLSTTTGTGQAMARKTFPSGVEVFYCPFDFWWPAGRVLRHLRPGQLIIAETEIWPNLYFRAWRSGIPVSVVNGRISDRAWPRYRRIRRWLAPLLTLPARFLMQSGVYAVRIRELGAPPERVQVTGNMKFDSLRTITPDPELAGKIRAAWGPSGSQALVAGSTMPGEEDILAGVFLRLRRDFPELRLLVAPRHPERFAAAGQAFLQRGIAVRYRSELSAAASVPADVILLDSIGELTALYSLAEVVFIGGTLVPAGGHNILEPAAAGRPVVVGPSMENFREIRELFQRREALLTVAGAAELEDLLRRLLASPAECNRIGALGRQLVDENMGAARRNLAAIYPPLAGKDSRPAAGS